MRKQGGVGRYALRRVCYGVLLVYIALTINFILIHVTPGDPVALMAGDSGSPEYYAEVRASLGLDRPLIDQYRHYLIAAAHGNLGNSIAYQAPVVNVIASRISATLLLMAPALFLGAVVGVAAGVVAGRRAGSRIDEGMSALTLVGASVPSFWVGQILVTVVSVRLGWLPVQGMATPRGNLVGWAHVIDVARHMVLPVLTLSLFHLTLIARLMRSSISEVLGAQFIRTARAKGLSPRVVLYRHGVRNALLPVSTVIGTQFGGLLSGAVLVETIFSWPGVGRLLYDSTLARDYPVLLGIFLLVSVAIVLANLATDLLYLLLDPRVSYR